MSRNRMVQLLRLPPRQAAAKIRKHVAAHWNTRQLRKQDRHAPSYGDDVPNGDLARFISGPSPELLRPFAAALRAVTESYLEHRFDLLGSGWVEVHHGMRCAGLDGHRYDCLADGAPVDRINTANRASSAATAALIPGSYRPIDWHIDFKSGFRWREDTWYLDVPYGQRPGIEIKLPWKLARMQHQVHLALAARLAKQQEPGFRDCSVYAAEVHNQILDFIAHNPPRFGANWRCAMDVAIRAANWLVAYDLLRDAGIQLDEDFDRHFKAALIDHGRHVMANLEWDEHHRGNHYLANIAGLIFIGAYLPDHLEAADWLTFAKAELQREMVFQFYEDGGNFEASTAYHRLSTEIALYATAIADAAAKAPVFAVSHYDRLRKALRFTAWICKPAGQAPQIGDNDSGRFLKLAPDFDLCGDPTENHLDHRHLLGAGQGFFGSHLLTSAPKPVATPAFELEAALMAGLTQGAPPEAGAPKNQPAPHRTMRCRKAAASAIGKFLRRTGS